MTTFIFFSRAITVYYFANLLSLGTGKSLTFFTVYSDLLFISFQKSRVADPDPDSIGSVDPDSDSESGSGSRRAKMTHKSRKKF
jgi:hypothetical protein